MQPTRRKTRGKDRPPEPTMTLFGKALLYFLLASSAFGSSEKASPAQQSSSFLDDEGNLSREATTSREALLSCRNTEGCGTLQSLLLFRRRRRRIDGARCDDKCKTFRRGYDECGECRCEVGKANFATCAGYLGSSVCGIANQTTGDPCFCAISVTGEGLCIQPYYKPNSSNNGITLNGPQTLCESDGDCEGDDVCADFSNPDEPDCQLLPTDCDGGTPCDQPDDGTDVSKICVTPCPAQDHDSTEDTVRCPEIDAEGCDPGEYRMKQCGFSGMKNFTADAPNSRCTSNITGFQAEGWYCASTFACGKEWKSFLPPASVEEVPLKEQTYTAEEMDKLAKAYNGSIDDTFEVLQNLLDKEDCRVLREFTDVQYFDLLESGASVKNPDFKHDYRLNVPMHTMERILKPSSLERVTKAFRDYAGEGIAITRIALRRSINDGSNRIEFHTDYGNSEFDRIISMITFLNEEGEISGGDLHYVTRNGIVKTHPGRGSAVIHGQNIVHGVDAYEGKRYILFFLGTSAMHQEMLPGIGVNGTMFAAEDEGPESSVVPPVHQNVISNTDEL